MSVSHESEAGRKGGVIEQSELQLQQFFLVEEQLKGLGIGLNKEIAAKTGLQLCESIKQTEMREPGLPESQFGRKLYTHIRTIFYRFTLGGTLSELAETNYPIERFKERLTEETIALSEKKKALEIPKVYPPKSMEMYMIYAEREYEKLLEAERGDSDRPTSAKRSSSKSRKKATTGAEGEVEADLTGDEGDDERFKAIQKKWRFKCAEDDDAYDKYRDACEKVRSTAQELSDFEDRTVVLSLLVEQIRTAGNTLVQKIQNAVMPYETIKQKLSGVVVLERTGETIANPFETNNLAGLCHILKSEYYTASLIQFNNDFSDTLRCSIPAAEVLINPMKAVQLTDKRIAEWTTMNYWKYMTMDIFFVNILLGYVPTSPLKDKCVVAVEDFIQKRESASDWGDAYSQVSQGGVAAMPIYRHLAEYIRRIENSSKHRSIVFGASVTGEGAVTTNKNPGKDKPFANKGRWGAGNVESAAAAGTTYSSVMARDQNVVIKDVETGREYPYTATKEECSVCYGKMDAGTHYSKIPSKCYKGTCRTCGLFGHKSSNCMQHPNTYVNGKQGQK